jgi:hypothetical protein
MLSIMSFFLSFFYACFLRFFVCFFVSVFFFLSISLCFYVGLLFLLFIASVFSLNVILFFGKGEDRGDPGGRQIRNIVCELVGLANVSRVGKLSSEQSINQQFGESVERK